LRRAAWAPYGWSNSDIVRANGACVVRTSQCILPVSPSPVCAPRDSFRAVDIEQLTGSSSWFCVIVVMLICALRNLGDTYRRGSRCCCARVGTGLGPEFAVDSAFGAVIMGRAGMHGRIVPNCSDDVAATLRTVSNTLEAAFSIRITEQFTRFWVEQTWLALAALAVRRVSQDLDPWAPVF